MIYLLILFFQALIGAWSIKPSTGTVGLEPTTLRLTGECYYQLSYVPILCNKKIAYKLISLLIDELHSCYYLGCAC